MLQINCPYCGARDETEFSYGGEAHIRRPLADSDLSDSTFAEYLFYRDNPKGLFLEMWCHTGGCRQWFHIARDTVSHHIVEIYPIDSLPKTKQAKKTYAQNWRRVSQDSANETKKRG